MQQRRLRLGDILDDYCPRERRITNHVVVAMVEDEVKQTRCTTCDAEHEYKQAKVPAPRRKKTGALFHEVLEGARPRTAAAAPGDVAAEAPLDAVDHDEDTLEIAAPEPEAPPELAASASPVARDEATDEEMPDRERDDDGPVHRRLIRATLPRPEGHVPERKEPEFTMRQPGGRGEFNGNRSGHRGRGHRPRHAQGQGQHQGGQRFGGQRQGGGPARQGSGAGQGQGQGQRQGNRPGQPSAHRGGGRPGGQHRGPGRKRGR